MYLATACFILLYFIIALVCFVRQVILIVIIEFIDKHSTIIAFIWGEHRKLSTLGCSPHTKAITVLIYRNYSKMFKNLNVLFYRRQQQKQKQKQKQKHFRYSKYNYGSGLRKKRIIIAFLVVRGCRSGDNLLSSFMLYMFGLSPSSTHFPWNIQIVLSLFNIIG